MMSDGSIMEMNSYFSHHYLATQKLSTKKIKYSSCSKNAPELIIIIIFQSNLSSSSAHSNLSSSSLAHLQLDLLNRYRLKANKSRSCEEENI